MIEHEKRIRELRDLPQTATSRLRLRIVWSGKGKPGALDIREFVTSSVYTGFTRRGLRIDATAFAALMRQAPAILRALKGNATASRPRRRTL